MDFETKMRVQEYDSQLYGFAPSSVVEGIKETMQNALKNQLESIGKQLKPKYKEEPVKDFTATLLQFYFKSIEKHTAELTDIVHSCFSIKDSLLLKEDSIQVNQFDESYERSLDQQLEFAKRKFIALGVMEKKLIQLIEKIVSDESVINGVLETNKTASDLEENHKHMLQAATEEIPTALLDHFVSALNLNGESSN